MNLLARDLWQDVRDAFRSGRGSAVADLWLQQTYPIDFSRGIFTLAVPNRVVQDWMEHRYRDELEAIFHDLTGSEVRVKMRVEESLPAVSVEPNGEATVQESSPFVVRPENRLAHAALQRLLREPASGNPVFIYGPAGVGKTALVKHHLQRFAEEFAGTRTSVSIHAEGFSESLVRAIREHKVSAFRGRMLAADLLVMEEVHRLRSKPRAQREFLTILRYYIERGRPVILTGRHAPNAIFLLDEALRSYFLSGLLLRVNDYSPASRGAVLEALSQRFVRPVPTETIERISHRVPGSFDRQVRFLEKIAAFAALANTSATIEFVAEKFPELAGGGERDVDMRQLIDRVAQEFGTTPDDIASSRKVRCAVLGRHVVIYLATVAFNLKARRVMRHLGGLSPSTTAYARRKVEQRRREDPVFDAQVRHLMDKLDAAQKLLF